MPPLHFGKCQLPTSPHHISLKLNYSLTENLACIMHITMSDEMVDGLTYGQDTICPSEILNGNMASKRSKMLAKQAYHFFVKRGRSVKAINPPMIL